jgi:hypothetical protein
MFSEWSFNTICTCNLNITPGGQSWYRDIQDNLFDTLAINPICDNFVDQTLTAFQNCYSIPNCPNIFSGFGYQLFPLNPPSRCHIIDLSPYTEVWLQDPNFWYLCGTNPVMVCDRSAWRSGNKPPNPPPWVGDQQGNITNNNIYTDPCKNNLPFLNNYK